MKKSNAALIILFYVLCSVSAGWAQSPGDRLKAKSIPPYPLAITYAKTTHLVFPYRIQSVDRGSRDVLAQKAEGTQNVLQIKAGSRNFPETNLTVITADGKLYSFLLHYAEHPGVLNLKVKATPDERTGITFSSKKNRAVLHTYAKKAYGNRKEVKADREKRYGMAFRMNGLFIHENVMYFRLRIANLSAINYTIDQLRFFIRDKKKVKRTAAQEIEIRPLYIYNNTGRVKGNMKHVLVVAVAKFTIPNKKYLAVQLSEKNGGRQLELDINNKKLVRLMKTLH